MSAHCPDRRNPRTCEHADLPRLCHLIRNEHSIREARLRNLEASYRRMRDFFQEEMGRIAVELASLRKDMGSIEDILSNYTISTGEIG